MPAFDGLIGEDFAAAGGRARDTSRPIMLIGYQDEENLGLGYLSATLRRFGYRVLVYNFNAEREEILAAARHERPLVIGLSLIFQFYLTRFAELVRTLREGGVACHLTIGGHFPSLSWQPTLEMIPELDSVVRFEGEVTLLELADMLSTGGEWRGIAGLAWRDDAGGIVSAPLRPLIHDLDSLPYPDRTQIERAFLGRRSTHILASRGCIRTCSFCSIHMFYRAAPGKVVRTRDPAHVADEIELLHERDHISLFLFQDDDFPVYGVKWQRWAGNFCDELHRRGLVGRILWKISCRADAVDEALFARMRDAGLYLVYMGLESGNDEGLETLNKRITVEQNLKAVATLKRLGIDFAFGFMLFEPATTFEMVRQDLDFLRAIVGDGCTAATFCRMVPYDGTPIKDELIRQGRFRGDVCNPYYDFLDPRLDKFCYELGDLLNVSGWVHGLESVSQQLNMAWSELAVMERLFPRLPGIAGYRKRLRAITKNSNALLFRVVDDISRAYTDGVPHGWTAPELRRSCHGFLDDFLRERDAFVVRNQKILLDALERDAAREPALAGN